MGPGRPPLGAELVRSRSGSLSAKQRLELILETLAGRRSIAEACQMLGVCEAQFHRLRDRALEGAVGALEPRPLGRPRHLVTPDEERIAQLEAELADMKLELAAAEIREELTLILPQISLTHGGAKKKRHSQGP